MEIKKGYKYTEVGMIPEDWEVSNIIDKSTLKARIGWQGLTTKEYLTEGNFYLITGTDFVDGRIKWDTCYFVDHNRYIQDKNIQLKEGDILITKDGTIGKVAYIETLPLEATLNSGVFVIRPRGEGVYYPLYVYYMFCSNYFTDFLKKLVAGSTINHLYQKDFVKFNIPLPASIQEQQSIATALSDIDALISELEKLINKKKKIKLSAMQELFKPKEGWKEVTIEEMCISGGLVRGPFGGSLKKECFVESGFKVYEQKNAIYKDIAQGNYFIDNDKFEELKRFEVKEGDFIISCSGTIGKIFQIPSNSPKGIINQALLKIKIDTSKYSEKYFYYYFSWDYFQSKIIDNTQGGAMKNLVGMPVFKSTLINIPSAKEEQGIIATTLSDIDNEIESLESQLSKYKQIKTGMMQELLTGKIRLIPTNN